MKLWSTPLPWFLKWVASTIFLKKIEITFHISNAIASLIIWIQGIWNNKSWNDFIVLCCKLMWFQFSTYIQKIYIHDAATLFFSRKMPGIFAKHAFEKQPEGETFIQTILLDNLKLC